MISIFHQGFQNQISFTWQLEVNLLSTTMAAFIWLANYKIFEMLCWLYVYAGGNINRQLKMSFPFVFLLMYPPAYRVPLTQYNI